MKRWEALFHKINLCVAVFLTLVLSGRADTRAAMEIDSVLIHADRVFDGVDLHTDAGVLIVGGQVQMVGPSDQFDGDYDREVDLGDSTILPGLIDLHGHVTFQHVPQDIVLRHGITTVRDVGGPLHAPTGGDGSLRLLSAGPIITAHGGYPIPVFGGGGHGHGGGSDEIAAPVATAEEAREVVRHFVAGGAVVIKVALEPGGEHGAPWSSHGGTTPPPWPMLSEEIVSAIVDEAHSLGKRVTAHVGEATGAELALNAGVDEWAHIPIDPIPDELLERAVTQGVSIVTTMDTFSRGQGTFANAAKLAELGADFLYGAEIAHVDIPWGIDAQELQYMQHLLGMTPLEVLQTATSKAGDYLDLEPLGTLTPGAPADLIAVRGNPLHNFKLLEYPDLVISSGTVIASPIAALIPEPTTGAAIGMLGLVGVSTRGRHRRFP